MNLYMLFKSEINDWENKIQSDEWFFENVIEKVTKHLTEEESFRNIDDAIDILITEQNDEQVMVVAFELLFELSIKSNTTQMSDALINNWTKIDNLITSHSEYYKNRFEEFKRWYRK